MHAAMRMGGVKKGKRQSVSRHEAEKFFVKPQTASENVMFGPNVIPFKVGQIVAATGHEYALRAGNMWYPNAVIVKLNPMVLVSQNGVMRWEKTVRPDCLVVKGQASFAVFKKCMERLEK